MILLAATKSNKLHWRQFGNKVEKGRSKSRSQGHWPWCHLKGHLSMHAKHEASISYGSKVKANIKVDNRQTNKQTNRQDTNNLAPIIT